MARRPAETASGRRGRPPVAGAASLDERLAATERERDALQARLTAAEAEIRILSTRQDEIANRIAWALDSLHGLIDEP